jgi:hypothetical protein
VSPWVCAALSPNNSSASNPSFAQHPVSSLPSNLPVLHTVLRPAASSAIYQQDWPVCHAISRRIRLAGGSTVSVAFRFALLPGSLADSLPSSALARAAVFPESPLNSSPRICPRSARQVAKPPAQFPDAFRSATAICATVCSVFYWRPAQQAAQQFTQQPDLVHPNLPLGRLLAAQSAQRRAAQGSAIILPSLSQSFA